ncbi:MAG TPA: two-component regulator propeller domain-containing protein, partial [Xanthomonadales bacterium]|nr:two-component regulator propeller domain-containing protein [Xanthomonadales bacterium]
MADIAAARHGAREFVSGIRAALARSVTLLALCAVATSVAALERAYYVERVSAAEDLAQNTVNALLQDRTGFLWIGTQGGLHRFDGYHFVPFQHDPEDPNSLADSFVTALAADDKGRLWVGTNGKGVSRYDAALSQFVFDAGSEQADLVQRRGAIGALLYEPGRGLW